LFVNQKSSFYEPTDDVRVPLTRVDSISSSKFIGP